VTLVAALVIALMALAAPAMASHDTAKAWGVNALGELGTGGEGPETCSGSSVSEAHESCSASPVAVSGLSGVVAVAGGAGLGARTGHSLALLENGTVMAWGANEDGELGDGTTSGPEECMVGETKQIPEPCSKKPIAISGLTEVVAIAASDRHSMALLKSGKVEEWGQLATRGSSDVPVEVAGVSGASAIAAGGNVGLAVVEGGRVLAWGSLVGDGSSANSTTPVPVCAVGTVGTCPSGPYLEGVTATSASNAHRLALRSDGTVVAWGKNAEGELGNGTTTESSVPVTISGLHGVTAISAGGLGGNGFSPFSLALLSNHTVESWGTNFEGELGDGSKTGPEGCGELSEPCSKVPVPVSGLGGVSAIAAHGRTALALLADGKVMSWGSNEYGELGTGATSGPEPCGLLAEGSCSTKPVEVTKLHGATGIGDGDHFALAFGPPPTVTGVRLPGRKHGHARGPASGGTTVTITGVGFQEVSAVKFGSTDAESFTVNSPTSITAVSPPHAKGTVDVTVNNGWGTSPASEADHFRYRRH
jgi:alpha-tubulin suppressor-like RCC1 family protein